MNPLFFRHFPIFETPQIINDFLKYCFMWKSDRELRYKFDMKNRIGV